MHSDAKSNTHLYIDEQNKVRIVIESFDGSTRTLKTDSGQICIAVADNDLDQVKIIESGAVLRHVTDDAVAAAAH